MLNFLNKKNNDNNRAFGYEYINNYNIENFTKVTLEDLIIKNNNKEEFLFLVSSNDCNICNPFINILKDEINNKETKVYYISLNDIHKDELTYNKFIKIDERLNKHLKYVPYLTYFKDGKLQSEIIGKSSKEKINDFLKNIK